ncbi:hypothetical protein RZE82_05360 [Mollicutes bacterium LVI A0039]|nr:hypothetical protein RZE82_05360 [Mollicutes bacterium LVI A0039]
METKIILSDSTFEVKAYKLAAFFHSSGTIAGYTLIRDADYYITTLEDKLVLKSVMDDTEYFSEIENVDTTARTFEIKGKSYKYKIA